jgi:hypothetical protein
MKNPSSCVEIKTVTWSKDSHGLFDYESKNVQLSKTKIDSSSNVYKGDSEIVIKGDTDLPPNKSNSDEAADHLFSIQTGVEGADKYFLKPARIQNLDENPQKNAFLIVRSLKDDEGVQKGYNLELGEVIRLGRIEYRVLEFQDNLQNVQSLLLNEPPRNCPFNLLVKDCNNTAEGKRQCRICLLDEEDTDEVLVNPCACKGTSEYMHIKCLQDWISSKVKKKVNQSASCVYWKKLNCEICKVPLPDLVEVEGKRMQLVPIYRSEAPYILLERVFYDKTKDNHTTNSKTMIVLTIQKDAENIKMGRGHDCDVRENDISVSRLHAYIKYQEGKFTITDNNSKFGTLILLRKEYEIGKRKVAIQSGRTVITFSQKPNAPSSSQVIKTPTPQ